MVLPIVERLADSDYDDRLDIVNECVDVDLDALVVERPEKTGLPLQVRDLVWTIDAPPSKVREEFRLMPRWWPC
ncbi:hypothetical protein [Halorubrum tebenquichense]|uniref:Uncharacterized protein n=1 Tax=Halorubrum tebenquichense DSM 14210 TaxID=1227485 RepID=M0E4T5_9EURY|nr:hypothetical protein [Halorubrum tebenquichense]ELZ41389.1 hypothetical protein C472_00955 [Halorubrum tebenquichense DSM 14210]